MSGNKFLAISAIVLVAVIMGMSAVTPMIMFAYAEKPGDSCPPKFFTREPAAGFPEREAKDLNGNGWVCITLPGRNGQGPEVIIDDSIPS